MNVESVVETRFFREIKTFEVLRDLIKKHNIRKFEFWSGACATGEEPYSLAIMFYEMGLSNKNVKILATDINPIFLDKARRGIYTKQDVEKSERGGIIKYFREVEEGYEIDKDIKKYIEFRQFNLRDFDRYKALREKFEFIFLRNVFIYFPLILVTKILKYISTTLNKKGYLFLGNKEVYYSDFFKRDILNDVVVYRKKEKSIKEKNNFTPKNITNSNLKRYEPNLRLFINLIDKGKIKKAKQMLLFFNKNSFEYWFVNGVIEDIENRGEEAKRCYLESISRNPEFPLSHLYLGNIYYSKFLYENAYREYVYALEGIENGEWAKLLPKDNLEFIKAFLKNRIGV